MTATDYLAMVNGLPKGISKSVRAANRIKVERNPTPKVKYNDGNYTGDLLDKVSIKDEGARVEYMNDHIKVTRRDGRKFRIIIQVEV